MYPMSSSTADGGEHLLLSCKFFQGHPPRIFGQFESRRRGAIWSHNSCYRSARKRGPAASRRAAICLIVRTANGAAIRRQGSDGKSVGVGVFIVNSHELCPDLEFVLRNSSIFFLLCIWFLSFLQTKTGLK